MVDPVIAADGHTYERSEISRWLQNKDISPLSRTKMANKKLIPNSKLKQEIQQWSETKEKLGSKSNVDNILEDDPKDEIVVDNDE